MNDACWQIYTQFEREVKDILFTVTFDKQQYKVYSPRIAELIVRVGMQIESISQRIYSREKKTDRKINYRTCIDYFNNKWKLSEKGIIIKENVVEDDDDVRLYLKPYKNECYKEALIGGRKYYCRKSSPNKFEENVSEEERCRAFKWENAYNNLKHNFYGSIKYWGNIMRLVEIMSALYILNIYWDPSYALPRLEIFGKEKDISDYEKSDIFNVFSLECCIDDEEIIVDMPEIKKANYDWFTFLDVRSIKSLDDMRDDYLNKNWDFVLDDKRYIIPEFIRELQKQTRPFRQFHFMIRNQIAEAELKPLKKK